MYEVKCIIADKRLNEFLRAVKLLTLEPPVVIPVDDNPATSLLEHGPKSRQANHYESRPKIEAMGDRLRKGSQRQVTSHDIKELMVKVGYIADSHSYALNCLIDSNVLRRSNIPGIYNVVSKNTHAKTAKGVTKGMKKRGRIKKFIIKKANGNGHVSKEA